MSRLPSRLQPLWPLLMRVQRHLTVVIGFLGRAAGPLLGERRLPRRGSAQSAMTAAAEPEAVTLHPGPTVDPIRRVVPDGSPAQHWFLQEWSAYAPTDLFTLDIRGGTTVAPWGAIITPRGTLDMETSDYWSISSWREHPVFLGGRLPRIEHVGGTVAVLAARGGDGNNYHFLMDVLPRLEVLRRCLPDVTPDAFHLPMNARFHRETLELAGLGDLPIIAATPDTAVRADRLLVPSMPNPFEMTPPWIVDWLRDLLPAQSTADKPRRLYVTRGNGPNTRRLEHEDEIWPALAERGFTRIDPGTMSMRDQIDHFAAATHIVGLHGAALTNLVFCQPGVRVLHLMAPTYVKHCFWAILDAIPDTSYRYVLTDGREAPPGDPLLGIQDDLRIAPERLLAEVDDLLKA